jgi:hypothetical protein
MSWKSIVITGLLCVVASPALAAPALGTKLLGLDTAGNWVWQVNVTPDAALFSDNPPNGVGGSVALEVGVTASNRNLISAGANTTNFPSANPGVADAAWTFHTAADLGVEANVATNQVFAALGSTYFTTAGAKEAFRIHTQRPTNVATTTTLTLSGGYTGNGRLAQAGTNFDTVTGVVNGTVRPGNARLEPTIGGASFALLLASYEVTPGAANKTWANGDFNGDAHTNASDFAILLANYNGVDPYWTANGIGTIGLATSPGAGSGGIGGAAVPEPTSLVLLALGSMTAAFYRRKS